MKEPDPFFSLIRIRVTQKDRIRIRNMGLSQYYNSANWVTIIVNRPVLWIRFFKTCSADPDPVKMGPDPHYYFSYHTSA